MTSPAGRADPRTANATGAGQPAARAHLSRRPPAMRTALGLFTADFVLNTLLVVLAVPGSAGAPLLFTLAGLIAAVRLGLFVGMWLRSQFCQELFAFVTTYAAAGMLGLAIARPFLAEPDGSMIGVFLVLRLLAVLLMAATAYWTTLPSICAACLGGSFRVLRYPGQQVPAVGEPASLVQWTQRNDWGWAVDVPLVQQGGLAGVPFVDTKRRWFRTVLWGNFQGFPAMVTQLRYFKQIPRHRRWWQWRRYNSMRTVYWDTVCAVLETGSALPELTVQQKRDAFTKFTDALQLDDPQYFVRQDRNVPVPPHWAANRFWVGTRTENPAFAQHFVTPQLLEYLMPTNVPQEELQQRGSADEAVRFSFRCTGDKVIVWSMFTADMSPEHVETQLTRALELYQQVVRSGGAGAGSGESDEIAPLGNIAQEIVR